MHAKKQVSNVAKDGKLRTHIAIIATMLFGWWTLLQEWTRAGHQVCLDLVCIAPGPQYPEWVTFQGTWTANAM